MTVNRLRGEVFSRYNSMSDFTKALQKINCENWTNKNKSASIVNGSKEPRLNDIQDIAKALDLNAEYIASLFFANSVTEM